MTNRTLAAAFHATVTRATPKTVNESLSVRDGLLLAALQRSATGLDQIVQRRVGLDAWGPTKS
jgi:hypothetical protein